MSVERSKEFRQRCQGSVWKEIASTINVMHGTVLIGILGELKNLYSRWCDQDNELFAKTM